MRILASSTVLIFAIAAAVPSNACDRHGGMFGQLSGAAWTEYNPDTVEADALFLEEQLSAWHKKNGVQPTEVKPAKPSFSNASSRASLAAQSRLAKKPNLAQGKAPKTKAFVKPESTSGMASR